MILALVQIAQIRKLLRHFKHALQRSDYKHPVVAVLRAAVAEQSHLQQLRPKEFLAGRYIYGKFTWQLNRKSGSQVSLPA